ncbi:MAG: hypothetical protein AAGA85_20485, partial [Bacteroidota bacterium]
MVHYFIGNLGHTFVIVSFVCALIGVFAYIKGLKNKSWENYGNIVFYLHAIGIFGVVLTLFAIINQHYFEYHYAWKHTSRFLP